MDPEQGPTPDQIGLELNNQSVESPEARLKQKFLDRTFLIVEDNGADIIANQVRQERGTTGTEKDEAVITAETFEEFDTALSGLLMKNGPRKITAIMDLEFPQSSGGPAHMRNGLRAVNAIKSRIFSWNSEHPDHVIRLEIVINSTTMGNLEEVRDRFGQDVDWSPNKMDAVSTIKNQLQKFEH